MSVTVASNPSHKEVLRSGDGLDTLRGVTPEMALLKLRFVR